MSSMKICDSCTVKFSTSICKRQQSRRDLQVDNLSCRRPQRMRGTGCHIENLPQVLRIHQDLVEQAHSVGLATLPQHRLKFRLGRSNLSMESYCTVLALTEGGEFMERCKLGIVTYLHGYVFLLSEMCSDYSLCWAAFQAPVHLAYTRNINHQPFLLALQQNFHSFHLTFFHCTSRPLRTNVSTYLLPPHLNHPTQPPYFFSDLQSFSY